MEVKMVNHLQGIQSHKSCNGCNYKQTTLNLGIIISVWLSHVNVLSIIIPKHVMLVVMDFILLAEPNLIAICELLLVKNSMRLVFFNFSDNKFSLNQLLISVNAQLIYSIKLVVFGLVWLDLYHPQVKIICIYCFYL